MDFGGVDRRRTKGDLKKKRLNRGYKKGGKFRSANVDEDGEGEKRDRVIIDKKVRKKKRKY